MNKKSIADPTKVELIHKAIRVNHAGERGAKMIYSGQIFANRDKSVSKLLEHMKDQELKHLDYFEKQIRDRKVRPTAMLPVWDVLGFSLGMVSSLVGSKAAMMCTEAVEEVIADHYQEQIDHLPEDEKLLKENIKKFRDEEIEHLDIATQNQSTEAPCYTVMKGLIKTGCRFAIKISSKI